jgi:GPH family glycoside/pentoside/hexuronide:cation symporter
VLPLVVVFALFWFPPAAPGSPWNLAWLLALGTAFFFGFSLVVNPYLAMLPDVARSAADRMSVSTLLAGFGLGAQVLAMAGVSFLMGRSASGLPAAVALACGAALVSLALPLCVRERTPDDAPVPPRGLADSLREALGNAPFRTFLVSKGLLWVAVQSVLGLIPFFVRHVLGFADAAEVRVQTAALIPYAVGPAFLWFALMGPLAARYSKRTLALSGFAVLALAAGLMATVGLLPGDRLLPARLLLALASYSVALVFSVPNAILAEIVDLDERMTGVRREALFFGAQGLFVKVAWGGSSLLVMGTQGLFHTDPGLAVQVTWSLIALVAAGAFAVFLRFPEDEALRRLGGGT